MKNKIFHDITSCIGKTPLVYLRNINETCYAQIAAKLESMNPFGSNKDRIAINIIEDAEKRSQLNPGSVIIEPTSGNTGIALAAICALKKYRCILVMPESTSIEKKMILEAYGAELHLTADNLGMKGAIETAEKLLEETPNSFMPQQFNNPANPESHYKTTGPEIWEDSGGTVDYIVAGIGTGGTISGIAQFLKKKNKEIKIIGVEPSTSNVLSGGEPGRHSIQGIGAGFVPGVLNQELLDEIITVTDEQALSWTEKLVKSEGILAGISSGAVLYAAYQLAQKEENQDKLIIAILPDGGEKYLMMRKLK